MPSRMLPADEMVDVLEGAVTVESDGQSIGGRAGLSDLYACAIDAEQWEVKNHKWSKYAVPRRWRLAAAFYPPDNMHRPTGPLRDGCHSVGYNIETKQVAVWNVGCERCHGPGSEHTGESWPVEEQGSNKA